ncbi:hypothetical protein [Campylobacter troglodytis]|uniref:hypothetical protein n=1 Tax=Campylobacter troglodytis TaxID=654363 RepID=UPI0011583721|nr:hypothetical protein [Campylobacter troglodytis]TQR61595.1 hypothetical protein DMC01_00005 [Campylobacter troglodytis]
MLIYGHKLIKCPNFYLIKDQKAKFQEGINCFEFSQELIQMALQADVKFGILAKNEDEILLANAVRAEFILIENEKLAKRASKMAEFYLFDSKILLITSSLKNLKKAYKFRVDGLILKELLAENL